MEILNNIPLKPYNTFGLEYKARFFSEFFSLVQLNKLMGNQIFKENNKLVLGGGSNILLLKDFEGLVLKNAIKGIKKIKEDAENVWLEAGAGENWHQFVMYCVHNNYGGVENLSLIPGTVGASPMQNIGAYGVELKDVFESLDAISVGDGKLVSFNKDDCKFGYRESIFKNECKEKYIITSVVFKLKRRPQFIISYGAIQQILDKNKVKELTIKSISDAIIEIRQSKLPDPALLGNSGSFFKNPEIDRNTLIRLQSENPEIPNYPVSDNSVKLAAGWLIEQCGWKGKRVGNTGCHKQQALVLVNYGHATGTEIWNLSLEIKKSVFDKFGVEIMPEVNVIN